jgi:hypothetical protein
MCVHVDASASHEMLHLDAVQGDLEPASAFALKAAAANRWLVG